jgi:peptidoglycan-associated lipoprotein
MAWQRSLTAHAFGTALVLIAVLAGCAKTPVTVMASAPAPSPLGPPPASASSGPRHAASAASPGATSPTSVRPSEFKPVSALRDVHFDFDRYDLRSEDAKVLDMDAAWLKDNARTLVLVEGHTDERGTNEYNLALGERRAEAVVNYLVGQGVRATRISKISYGEERPLCVARTEGCWAQNRRAHFLVKAE